MRIIAEVHDRNEAIPPFVRFPLILFRMPCCPRGIVIVVLAIQCLCQGEIDGGPFKKLDQSRHGGTNPPLIVTRTSDILA